MRLSTIKLAGFKSFVDPTTLHLPTNMTGVVGPNGCGKSNIIDAVRWVMGESSASRLRGDALTDVIFSGSSARKPVSQATVELIFDNSDRAIGGDASTGQYAAFNEISVKRTVGRDSLSLYSLNGSKCRRRDITDLFLGTGLGPRSYSIIEQGMISQIIEARPEELRVYLEEAAGISRYQERRRETETRIRHTRENLDRLNDLRDEVGKQLEHLRRQARQAEQYQGLQADRRLRDAEWNALQFRALDGQLQALRTGLSMDETRLQQLIAQLREAERELETGRARRDQSAEALNQTQAASYEIGGQLARIEQQIAHQRDLGERLQRARDEAESTLGELRGHIGGDQERLDELRAAMEQAEPQLQRLQSDDAARQQALREAEEQLADWQRRWDAHAAQASAAARAADVERTRLDHREQQGLEAQRREQALAAERAGLDPDALTSALQALHKRHDLERQSLDQLGADVETRGGALEALEESQRGLQAQLSEVRERLQAARGRLSSLETLQHAALGQEQGEANDWLRAQSLQDAPRLGAALQVEEGFETATEAALGALLEAVLVDNPVDWLSAASTLREGRLGLVAAAADSVDADIASTALAARVSGPAPVRRLLAHWHVADDLEQGQALLAGLADTERVVTRDGERLGHGWLQLQRSGAAKQGALLRERKLQALRGEVADLARSEQKLDAALTQLRSDLQAAGQQREAVQRRLFLAHRSVAELAGQLQSREGTLATAQQRIERIEAELSELADADSQRQQQLRDGRTGREAALARMAELEITHVELERERFALADARDAAREAARAARDAAHALALTLEAQRAQSVGLAQALQRMGGQSGQLDQRLTELTAQLEQGDAPVSELEVQRQQVLQRRIEGEQSLAQARTALENIDAELRGFEQTRQQRDQQSLAQREAIAQRRLDQQALSIQAEQLTAAVRAADLDIAAVIDTLADDAQPATWERAVLDLDAKLRRLEPINLAAIAEHAESAQRKEYLDAQHADLTTALDTLEGAIRKIDKETRGRFRDTFDRVNAGVQELYPRLFGGGHAYLELTGEDLLDAGVTIMARPPGKRVSSISLLSGGEKAMTAVALVFSIFRLNPAPFCLLDEVDAPLDEANIGRFTALVGEMSEQVQFLFVTHNKATMEAAHQLSGVTMREPGVSRLVSVDLGEAAQLAGAA